MIERLYKFYTSIISALKMRRLSRIATIGANSFVTKRFMLVKNDRGKFIVGNNCRLDGKCLVFDAAEIMIGDNCSFRSNTFIGALEGVYIGNNVYGAENVYIVDNNNHPTSPKARYEMTLSPPNTKPWKWSNPQIARGKITIEDCVWLGRNCMIFKGVTIGRGSIVAAGAVVTKSVPPFSVVAGNPARVVKTLDNDLDDIA